MSKSNRKISIILPTYNRERCVRRAVESVLQQSYADWELIVVDNSSTDHTVDIVASYKDPRIRLTSVSNNGIVALSRNRGITLAKGSYLAFLDSDDLWYKEKLQVCISHLEAYKADIAYHKLGLLNGKSLLGFSRQMQVPVIYDLLRNGNGIATSSVVVRKEIFTRIGCFSEESSLVAVEDYDAWVRLSLMTEKYYFIDEVLGEYELGVDGLLGGLGTSKRRLETLLALKESHDGYYREHLGHRPGWLLNALAMQYTNRTWRKACLCAVECVTTSQGLGEKLKAALIVVIATHRALKRFAGIE